MINYQFINKNGELEWGKREPTLEELAQMEQEEIIETDWLHNYQKRIVVNPQILFVAEAVNEILGMFALISIRGLPQEETKDGFIHIYVNEIKPAEAYLIEKYSEYITVEDRE